MVQINGNDNFWAMDVETTGAADIDLRKIEIFIKAQLPARYIYFMKIHDGGELTRDCFWYKNYSSQKCKGSIGKMFKLLNGYESILGELLRPPEFFPKGLVPFADDGGGNLTCFDYRNTKKDPPIVFWVCGDPEGEDVHFVANSFDEFLNVLYKSEC